MKSVIYALEFNGATNKDSSPLVSSEMAELPLFDNFAQRSRRERLLEESYFHRSLLNYRI
jgi:hypothetical protein